jgi:hypothetical protein
MAKSEGKITIEVQSKGRNAIAPFVIYTLVPLIDLLEAFEFLD